MIDQLMRENALKTKSLDLAVRSVKLYKWLCKSQHEFVMSKQLLRSVTAIGVLYRGAEQAESKRDFIHKLLYYSKRSQ